MVKKVMHKDSVSLDSSMNMLASLWQVASLLEVSAPPIYTVQLLNWIISKSSDVLNSENVTLM